MKITELEKRVLREAVLEKECLKCSMSVECDKLRDISGMNVCYTLEAKLVG